jgi:peptidoglycan/xylan/chitin deacetylase (PgdA/CDA1 family)
MFDLHRRSPWRLPVLMYHRIGKPQPGAEPSLTVLPKNFADQIRWLKRLGYTSITASQLATALTDGSSLPSNPVLLTFDDAYADLCQHAFPLLLENGFSATVFVVTGRLNATNTWDQAKGWSPSRLMSAAEIRSWAAQGIDFGAHSRSHADLTLLAGAELEAEVAGSAQDLCSLLDRRIASFAYPYGQHNEAVRVAVARWFAVAFTCEEGLNSPSIDPLRLRRAMVQPGTRRLGFGTRLRLGSDPLFDCRCRLRLGSRLAQVLGK